MFTVHAPARATRVAARQTYAQRSSALAPRRAALERRRARVISNGLFGLGLPEIVVIGGVAAVLFTDVGRDGLLKGCNVEATVDLARAVDIPVIASGGVAGIADIHVLALHARDGIEGVITGRALYDGRLDLAAALSVAAAA